MGGQSFHDLDANIRPAKAMDEVLYLAQPKLCRDVFLDQRRRGCRERQHRDWTKDRQVLAQHAVVRSKVVAPLRDAVRFVDGDQRGLSFGEHLWKARNAEPFGSDKQELKVAVQVFDASST